MGMRMVIGWWVMGMLACVCHAQVEPLSPSQQQADASRLARQADAARQPALQAMLRELGKQGESFKGRDAGWRDWLVRASAASRVAGDVASSPDTPADAAWTWYAVPAMSDTLRLPDRHPQDGEHRGTIGLVAARGEYEPASFLIYSFSDIEKVQLEVTDLVASDGSVFPRDRLDLKVVKVWYQNGNAWFSYFADVGLTLVPELLLHDENLIRVDTAQQANYAHIRDEQGQREVWISAPNNLNVPFDPYQKGFVDADTLQPVRLEKGLFKQFLLTAKVDRDAKPGVYRGSVRVTAPTPAPGRPSIELPVTLRVLPFELPLPMAYHDEHKPFLVSLMNAWPSHLPADHPAMLPTLRNLRAHNILHTAPGLNIQDPRLAEDLVPLFKAAGFESKPIVHRHGFRPFGRQGRAPMTYEELRFYDRSAKAWVDFYTRHFGHHDVFLGLGDEPSAGWVMNTRPMWRVLDDNGVKSQVAGHRQLLTKGGHLLDLQQAAGQPGDGKKARPHNEVGFSHVAFYAGQHNGAENPSFVRRQHGLLGYLSGFTAVHNYMFAYGPWNDLASNLYKPMVLAYPISNGLVDTLAWEGFREGVDDMRYATLLVTLARQAAASDDLDRVYAGRKALLWLSLMDGSSVELDGVRLEMIRQILQLQGLQTPSKK